MQLPNKPSRIYIIQDTHFWCKNISNRKDYKEECVRIYDTLVNIIKNNRREKTYVVFLGDIFHSKFADSQAYLDWFQKMQVLRAICNGVFSVIGNHEITYRDQNPFWSLVGDVESMSARTLGLKGTGNLPIIRIPDSLEIYDNQMIFNHFNTRVILPEGKINFLFCHNYWMTKQLSDSLAKLNIAQVDTKYIEYGEICDGCAISHFNEAFFGHNHMLMGDYKFDWDYGDVPFTNAHFCGSLGLTNINEVIYTESERNLYYIDFDETGYNIDKFVIQLPKYDTETVDTLQASKDKEKYKTAKYKKSLIKKYDLTLMDPVAAIRKDLENDAETLELFDELGKGGVPGWVTRLI